MQPPIIGAIQRRFKNNDTIRKYYTEKIGLLNQTDLLDSGKVALLTDGLPKYYHGSLLSNLLSTSSKWLVSATQLENLFRSNLSRYLSKIPIPARCLSGRKDE
jgi:hypothetical protein